MLGQGLSGSLDGKGRMIKHTGTSDLRPSLEIHFGTRWKNMQSGKTELDSWATYKEHIDGLFIKTIPLVAEGPILLDFGTKFEELRPNVKNVVTTIRNL